ncbi:pentapeptide repeat-containing protein [Lacinutrix algicola]|uniref:pentapeptide repeat-containing protein n=1 Tax=Lacinutrix algicola TaxID=342954 RepID=UPI0006E1DD1E|nr:pentapeptide repeat-containing protein [Lacinutrix algicola]
MNLPFITDQNYNSIDYTTNGLPKAEYDNCTFKNCNFSNTYLSGITFLECEFIDCNFSSVKLGETAFKDVIFRDCKLLGAPFNECNSFLLAMTFNNCQLNLSSFYNLTLKNTQFNNCKLEKTDFSKTNLQNSVFNNCNLHLTVFENTNIEKVDFRTSYNYSISPSNNKIKGAKFSKNEIFGLLKDYKIIIE